MASGESTLINDLSKLVPTKTLKIEIVPIDSKENTYCKTCCKKFKSEFDLECHMRIHNKVKPFVCSECDRKYDKQYHLKQHVTHVHTRKGFIGRAMKCEIGQFICGKCLDSFEFEVDYEAHVLTHAAKSKPFACAICKKYYSGITGLEKHMMVHTDEKQKVCLHCDKEFKFRYLLLNHLMAHTNVKPFTCQECGNKFRQKYALDKHIIRHKKQVDEESSKDSKSYECNIDIKESSLSLSAITGEQSSNNKIETESNPRNIPCSICNHSFSNKEVLDRHLLVHASIDLKTCIYCNKVFQKKSNLLKHLIVHKKAKSTNKALKNQEQSDFKPQARKRPIFACSKCDYNVTRKSSLEKHLLKHNDSFECTLCDHTSEDLQALDVHFSSHTGEMPVSCYMCNYKAAYQRNLDQHYKMEHNVEPLISSVTLKDLKIS